MRSPDNFEDFVLFDPELFAFGISTDHGPGFLVEAILVVIVVAEGKVHTTVPVCVTLVGDCQVSSASEHRAVVLDALYGLLILDKLHLLKVGDRQ